MRHTLSSLTLLMMSLTLPLQAETLRLPDLKAGEQTREVNGIVRFHSLDLTLPCTVITQSHMRDIALGAIDAGRFHQAGDRSQPVHIRLNLKNCLKGAAGAPAPNGAKRVVSNRAANPEGERTIQLIFMGEADPSNAELLRIHGTVQGAGIRLLDINGNALAFNQTARSYLINAGDSEFDFMAALESTGGHVSNGEFSSLIRLKMEYL